MTQTNQRPRVPCSTGIPAPRDTLGPAPAPPSPPALTHHNNPPSKLKSIDKKIDEFDEFSESAKRVLSANAAGAADASDEKYTIVVAEMQKLKNQVRGLGGSVVDLLCLCD